MVNTMIRGAGRAAVALVTTLCLGCGGTDAVRGGDSSATCLSSDTIKVGTCNIRVASKKDAKCGNGWEERKGDLANLIRELDMDVFGLQEVHTDGPYQYLCEALKDWEIVDDYGITDPVAYRKSRFELLGKGVFWLSETPDIPHSKGWGAACVRPCIYLILRDCVSGGRLCFVNTHTDHKSELARLKGVELILERMKAFSEGLPVVFVGDHNCGPETEPAMAIRRALRDARDVSEKKDPGPINTFHNWGKIKDVAWRRCDYIYVSNGIRVLDFVTHDEKRPGLDRYPSDHYILTATIDPFAAASRTEAIRAKLLSDDRNYVFVTMHRGDWRNYPENSRGAIESCIALGADIVELDARMTKDGRFVLLHDESLDRTTDGHGKVSERTFAEVKALHLKMGMGGKDARVTDYPVLSLEEALELTRGKILVNIDKFTLHPREILEAVDKVGALREVLVKSTLSAADAKTLFGDYWTRVESGELLYMPVVQFCWKQEAHAAEILPGYLSLEPRPASMYEICLKDAAAISKLDAVKAAPGRPRIWINTMWDVLAAGCGEADRALPKGRVLRLTDPDAVWGRALGWGATMLQSDYGAELLVYLNRIGRHDIAK